MEEAEAPYLTTDEAAKILGCHKYTLMAYCRKKKLRYGRSGRKYFFTRHDLDCFIWSNGSTHVVK